MARRIKIYIDTPEKKLNLPSVGKTTAVTFLRFGLWGSKFMKDMEPETRQMITDNKDLIIGAVKELFDTLQDFEPFTLVEVEGEDSHIHIEVI